MMWNRDKILDIADRTGMTETQIYKWWWDQTRKRAKRLRTFLASSSAVAASVADEEQMAMRESIENGNEEECGENRNAEEARIDSNLIKP